MMSASVYADPAAERAHLLRLCRHFTHDGDAAEDLAQESLFEAWRCAHKLSSTATEEERLRWLSAIARNVCLRWARRRGRDLAHLASSPHGAANPSHESDAPSAAPADDLALLPDQFDLEIELERAELVTLLDRAMALLPPDTRRVLYEQIVAESPLAETAQRLGLTEGAVAMRLQRGKLALRRILTTELHEDALAYGLFSRDDVGWQRTTLWCTTCGMHRLEGRFLDGHNELQTRCPACRYLSHSSQGSSGSSFGWDGVTGFRAVWGRIMDWHRDRHAPYLAAGAVPCERCHRPIPIHIVRMAPSLRTPSERFRLMVDCHSCNSVAREGYGWLLLCLAEGRRFLREHPRVRMAGTRRVHAHGGDTVLTTFESVTGPARYEVLSELSTLRVLEVHGAPPDVTSRPAGASRAPRAAR